MPVFDLEHYYPVSSVEADAWNHVQKYTHTHHVTAQNIAYAARYEALKLFLQGDGVYIPPRDVAELYELLERYAMSYLLTNISYLRATLKGTDFSQMKTIAFDGLRDLVREHHSEFIRLHSNKPDWYSPKKPAVRVNP